MGRSSLPLDKCVNILCDLGLTPNQSRVYLAAVQCGIASASRVSQASSVRREDTYRTLPKLERLGLVQRISDKPMKIRAVPVEEGFSILIKNWQDETRKKELELTGKRAEFLRHFRAYHRSAVRRTEESHYSLLLERDIVISRLVTMIMNAEKEIVTVTSHQEFLDVLPLLSPASREMTRAHSVKIRLILDELVNKKLLLKNIENYFPGVNTEVRYAGRSLSHYLIADFRSVLMATSPEPSIGKLPYLWTDTAGFAEVLQKNFEELWQTSVSQ